MNVLHLDAPAPRIYPPAPDDPPPGLDSSTKRLWRRLAAVPSRGAFDSDQLPVDTPLAVRRWLNHAIAPGCELSGGVELEMHGEIKLNDRWHEFAARQLLVPGQGFVWRGHTRVMGLRVSGFDRYGDGAGEMMWRTIGAAPVVQACGPDVTRSAAGRLAAEIALCPTAFGALAWTGLAEDAALGRVTVDGYRDEVRLNVEEHGRLKSVSTRRWGNPLGAMSPCARYPFGVDFEQESRFGDLLIPSRMTASWFWGTPCQSDGTFYRATITAARLLPSSGE